MKKIILLTGILALVNFGVAFAGPVDISGWQSQTLEHTGWDGGDGAWTNDGTTAVQTRNSDASVLLSNQVWQNTTFQGSFGVTSTSDDDWLGIVFGYTSPTDYYLFDWKQSYQSVGGQGFEGFAVSHITGSKVNLWSHKGKDIVTMATDFSSTNGWADNVMYNFSLGYTDTNVKITVSNGTNILTSFDLDGVFASGKIGFYSYSQVNTAFSALQAEVAPVPEPATMLLFGAGLVGLAAGARRKKK